MWLSTFKIISLYNYRWMVYAMCSGFSMLLKWGNVQPVIATCAKEILWTLIGGRILSKLIWLSSKPYHERYWESARIILAVLNFWSRCEFYFAVGSVEQYLFPDINCTMDSTGICSSLCVIYEWYYTLLKHFTALREKGVSESNAVLLRFYI